MDWVRQQMVLLDFKMQLEAYRSTARFDDFSGRFIVTSQVAFLTEEAHEQLSTLGRSMDFHYAVHYGATTKAVAGVFSRGFAATPKAEAPVAAFSGAFRRR